MGDLKNPWYSREYAKPGGQGGYPGQGQPQTLPSVDNSARISSNARPKMPGTQMPGGTPEWYGRATQQMPPQITPPPGVGLAPPRPDAPERRRWRG